MPAASEVRRWSVRNVRVDLIDRLSVLAVTARDRANQRRYRGISDAANAVLEAGLRALEAAGRSA